MKKRTQKIMAYLLALGMLASVFPNLAIRAAAAGTGYDGGNGTAAQPYRIASAETFRYFTKEVNNHNFAYYDGVYFELTGNIDLKNEGWQPIGAGGPGYQFRGSFDGNGYTIANLSVTAAACLDGNTYAGLFGYLKGSLSNLNVTGTVSGGGGSVVYAGGLIGYLSLGTVTNCSFAGTVSASGSAVNNDAGGIVGYSGGASIAGCTAVATVTAAGGVSNAGGIAGYCAYDDSGRERMDSSVKGCYSKSAVTASGATESDAGGIAGSTTTACTVENCRAAGTVTANTAGTNNYAGGLAGYGAGAMNLSSFEGTVTAAGISKENAAGGLCGICFAAVRSCYADGSVTSTEGRRNEAGGLAAKLYGTLINCYQTGPVTTTCGTNTACAQNDSGGLCGTLETDQFTNFSWIYNCYHTGGKVTASGGTYNQTGGLAAQSGGYDATKTIFENTFWLSSDCGKSFTHLVHKCAAIGSFANSAGTLTAVSGTKLSYGTSLLKALNTWVSTYSAGDYSGQLSSWVIVDGANGGYPVLALCSTAKTAAPTSSSVLVDGVKVPFEAYTIDSSNYFKLRDLAMALKGSAKQFEAGWDGASNAISLTTGTAYTAVGGELSVSGNNKNVTAVLSTAKVYVDGKNVGLTAYTIGGNNYFKLRDVAAVINFGVAWNSGANSIGIDTSTGYTA